MDSIQKTLRLMDTSIRNLDVDLANNSNKQQCGENDLFSEVMTVRIHFLFNLNINISNVLYLLNY